MTSIGCAQSVSALLPLPSAPRGGGVRRLAPVIAPALVAAALACREDTEPPTAAQPEPALVVTPAHTLAFRQVSAGKDHTCGVTVNYRVYCWGQNVVGQLGNGTLEDSRTPVAVAGRLRFRRVSAGGQHTCGVTTTGAAYCWGYNDFGQLGHGSSKGPKTCDGVQCSTRPVAVLGKLRFRQLSAGSAHTCGATEHGVGYCWGINRYGELGNRTSTGPATCGGPGGVACSPRPAAVAGGLRFRQVSAGEFHTCGVTSGKRAYCWGINVLGSLGNGTSTGPEICADENPCSTKPVRVVGRLAFRVVRVGGHTCGVTTHSAAYCWGSGGRGELGNGQAMSRPRPVAVAGGLRFRQVRPAPFHTCGVTTHDVAYCWGENGVGQLGIGTDTGPETCSGDACSTRPIAVTGGLPFREVSADGAHSCGVTTHDVAYCWGHNGLGQLGDGTSDNRLSPVAVAAPEVVGDAEGRVSSHDASPPP